MEHFKGTIISKLPNFGTSIFAVMTRLAEQHQALNLSQGFPDFDVSRPLVDLVSQKMNQGLNQYAPMPGLLSLRERIADHFNSTYNSDYHAETEITITSGATEAIFSAITAFIKDDDEVIVFEPAYDAYGPAVRLNGGMVKYAQLKLPDFSIDWNEVTRMISSRTKMIIINSPHNPTGAVLKKHDLERLNAITKKSDILVISDEVYEHIMFDNLDHCSVASFPELAERSLVVGSFGKTFHATGWKTGFVLAPANLMAEFRKTHQFVVFAVNTPVQNALADYMKEKSNYLGLGAFFQKKRDYFLDGIQSSRFEVVPSHGTYFQLLDYSKISDEKEFDFAARLVKEHGIAAIPVSPFYHKNTENRLLRFCFAKNEDTLEKAAEILCKI
ncbi:MAG: aminotransferase class I/II-fold pyridoxal phosphate-dependent enzyme [Bacteroidales bacterium]|nr:aminotransferase class I/II-fold pyridoxal phosphate-dependent enzyme [Bacteroidales bacterium]